MLRFNSWLMIVLIGASTAFAADPPATEYKVTTWPIGGPGRWDYITVDAQRQLLYVPRSTHTMVLNESTGKTVADIPGQQRNHGVALVPDAGRGFITDGQDASVTIFDLKTNEVLGKIHADDDADGVVYDPASHKILVACGDAGVMVPIATDVDPKTGKADAPLNSAASPSLLSPTVKARRISIWKTRTRLPSSIPRPCKC